MKYSLSAIAQLHVSVQVLGKADINKYWFLFRLGFAKIYSCETNLKVIYIWFTNIHNANYYKYG